MEVSWSVSKHKTFADCRRAWWWNYYGYRDNARASRLKGLTNILFWGGNLVHDAIERYLVDLKSGRGRPREDAESVGAFVRNVTHVVARDNWRESVADGRFRLQEHEYGQPVSDHDKAVLVGLVSTCLHNFFASEVHAELAAGKLEVLTVEDKFSFDVMGVPVTGRMDLAYRRRDDGRVHIVDWKTAKNPDSWTAINRVQVATYSLYAYQAGWVGSPDEITTTLAYLTIPEWRSRASSFADLAEARDFIARSGGNMRAAVEGGLEMERFPQCGKQWTCRRCFYRELCYPQWDGR